MQRTWLGNPRAASGSLSEAAAATPVPLSHHQPPPQSLTIEYVCLEHVPPPLLRLAAAPGSRLRRLRLHCCQLRRLPAAALPALQGITSLELSGG